MILPDDSATQIAVCATCPECDRVLVLGHLPPESKRPFVQGRAQGWVLVCRGCGCEFPVRNSQIFQAAIEVPQIH